MTTERIKELEAKVVELEMINAEQDRSLGNRAFDIRALEDELDSLAQKLANIDCGSAQLNRCAATCYWHGVCLTCECEQLRAELEKLRKHEVSRVSAA